MRQPNKSFYLLTGMPAEWEQQLVFRLSHSALVHLAAVVRVEPYFNHRLAVHLLTGAMLVCSSAQTAAFRRWLGA